MKTLITIILLACLMQAQDLPHPALTIPQGGTERVSAVEGDSAIAVIESEINLKLQQQAFNNKLIQQYQRQLNEATAMGIKLQGAVEALTELLEKVKAKADTAGAAGLEVGSRQSAVGRIKKQ